MQSLTPLYLAGLLTFTQFHIGPTNYIPRVANLPALTANSSTTAIYIEHARIQTYLVQSWKGPKGKQCTNWEYKRNVPDPKKELGDFAISEHLVRQLEAKVHIQDNNGLSSVNYCLRGTNHLESYFICGSHRYRSAKQITLAPSHQLPVEFPSGQYEFTVYAKNIRDNIMQHSIILSVSR